jgi:hypothetical protein
MIEVVLLDREFEAAEIADRDADVAVDRVRRARSDARTERDADVAQQVLVPDEPEFSAPGSPYVRRGRGPSLPDSDGVVGNGGGGGDGGENRAAQFRNGPVATPGLDG